MLTGEIVVNMKKGYGRGDRTSTGRVEMPAETGGQQHLEDEPQARGNSSCKSEQTLNRPDEKEPRQ